MGHVCFMFYLVWLFNVFNVISKTLQQDTCTGFSSSIGYSHSQIVDCIKSVPVNKNVREKSIGHFVDILGEFVFQDSAMDVENEFFNVSVNVIEELNDIKYSTSFLNDYEFQYKVQEIIGRLGDAHTSFIPPLCYSSFRFLLPFHASSKIHEGIQKLYVNQWNFPFINYYYPVLYPSLEHVLSLNSTWEIITINNNTALDVIESYAQNNVLGISKSQHIRFNFALKNFFHRSLINAKYPTQSTIYFTLEHSITKERMDLETKWIVKSDNDWDESITSFVSNCGNQYESTGEGGQRRSFNFGESIKKKIKNLGRRGIIKNDVALFESLILQKKSEIERMMLLKSNNDKPNRRNVLDSDYVKVNESELFTSFINLQSSTGVIHIHSFSPFDQLYGTTTFVNDLLSTVSHFGNHEIEHLIVDVRGNGGGYIVEVLILLQVISKYPPRTLNLFGDMIKNKYFSSRFCKNNKEILSALLDTSNNPMSDLWTNSPLYTRGGDETSQYSKLFTMDNSIPLVLSGIEQLPIYSPYPFDSHEIIVLTDGNCASACGIFVRIIKAMKLARVITQGGIFHQSNVPMPLGIAKGASITTDVDLYDASITSISCIFGMLGYWGGCNCERPSIPVTYSMLAFSWYELYPYTYENLFDYSQVVPSQPIEFTGERGDFHLWNWDFDYDNPFELYEEHIIPFFDLCIKGEVRINKSCISDVIDDNIVMGNPCGSNATFNHTTCVIKGCVRGFYLTNSNECSQMPIEPFDILYDNYISWGNYVTYMFGIYVFVVMLFIISIACLPGLACALLLTSCCFCCMGIFCFNGKRKRRRRTGNLIPGIGGVRRHSEITKVQMFDSK